MIQILTGLNVQLGGANSVGDSLPNTTYVEFAIQASTGSVHLSNFTGLEALHFGDDRRVHVRGLIVHDSAPGSGASTSNRGTEECSGDQSFAN